jgi:hypothetical protein
VGLKDLKMGTSPAVMTARQHGKSIFRNNPTAVWVDEWTQESERPKEYLEFNDDPLALVCAMLRKGKQYSEIAEALHGNYQTRLTRNIPIRQAIEAEDRERAIVVRKHFRNKILMRRLKNINISKFMLAVDDLIESPRRIDKENVSPLLKLPDFYEEDKATEAIFDAHTSLPSRQQRGLHTTIEYVGTVKRRSSRSKLDIQYWRTPNNYLVRLQFPLNDMGLAAWQFLAQQGKVNIKSETGVVTTVRGYDYNVYALGAKYEIEQIG